jgi:outer membrane protein assembly factor BamB
MKKRVGVMAFAVLAATTVVAQGQSQLHTRPAVLPEEALHRLNLKQAWRAYVPTEGRRDGLFSVQVLDTQILVQTRGGVVIALDPVTGATQWRSHAGMSYLVAQPLSYNGQSVFLVNGARMYALQRSTGVVQWQLTLPGAPTAPPVADDVRLYVPVGSGRLHAYELPRPGTLTAQASVSANANKAEPPPSAPGAVQSRVLEIGRSLSPLNRSVYLLSTESPYAGPSPQPLWDFPGNLRVEQAPLLFQDIVLLATVDGAAVALSKYDGRVLYRLQYDTPISAPLGQHGGMAYGVTQNLYVGALDMYQGKTLWRATTSATVFQKPDVNDEDVYVAGERVGLSRINRLTGEVVWRSPSADRFLAANPKFVYASDRSDRLLILDRARGIPLAVYDTRDFVVPVSNEWTDRLFLAANDGSLLCLHDRAYPKPLRMKTTEEQAERRNGKAETPGPAEKSEK